MNPNVQGTIAFECHTLKHSYFAAGASLIISSMLTLPLAVHHPEVHTAGGGFLEYQAQIASIQSSSAWGHGLLIVMLVIFTNGQYWLYKAHGENRFLALLGLVLYANGAIFGAMAAATSGFILPKTIASINSSDRIQTAMGQQIIGMLNNARDVFHHFSAVAITIGILCLACALCRVRRQVGTALGGGALTVGSLVCIALVTHRMPPTVHGVIVFAVLLALWNLVAAIALIRKSTSTDVT